MPQSSRDPYKPVDKPCFQAAYEYKIVLFDLDESEVCCNSLGAVGWELVTVRWIMRREVYRYWFKRRVG